MTGLVIFFLYSSRVVWVPISFCSRVQLRRSTRWIVVPKIKAKMNNKNQLGDALERKEEKRSYEKDVRKKLKCIVMKKKKELQRYQFNFAFFGRCCASCARSTSCLEQLSQKRDHLMLQQQWQWLCLELKLLN